jgi:hypothetical protein
MTNLPPDHDALVAGLRTQAQGVYAAEAAVELLIAHGAWLRRADFRDELVDGPRGDFAWIDWHRIPELLEHTSCSGSEARVLALAAELVGIDTGRSLDELLSPNLDDTNRRRVLDAIAHTLNMPAAQPAPPDRLLTDVVDVFAPGEDALWIETICGRLDPDTRLAPDTHPGLSPSELTDALRRLGVPIVALRLPRVPGGQATRSAMTWLQRGIRRHDLLEVIGRAGGAR